MKLEKNNKYNRKIALGLAAIITSGMILSGCNKDTDVIEVTPTPIVEVTPTATIAPTPTVAPTATPEPTATPVPELSYEEEMKLLGIKTENYSSELKNVKVINYEIDGIMKIAFTYFALHNNNLALANWFSEDIMFDFVKDIDGVSFDAINNSYFEPAIDSLNGAKIIKFYSVSNIALYFEKFGIELSDSEYDDIIDTRNTTYEEFLLRHNKVLNMQEIADLYLTVVPKQYRVTAAEVDPANYVVEETPKTLVK